MPSRVKGNVNPMHSHRLTILNALDVNLTQSMTEDPYPIYMGQIGAMASSGMI